MAQISLEEKHRIMQAQHQRTCSIPSCHEKVITKWEHPIHGMVEHYFCPNHVSRIEKFVEISQKENYLGDKATEKEYKRLLKYVDPDFLQKLRNK